MAIVQSRPLRKPSGARYVAYRKKRVYELGRLPTNTKIGKPSIKVVRCRGANEKKKILSAETVNLFNPKTKKYVQAKIKAVVENKANRHFIRRNIITMGAVIDTDAGKAKVTSRPGQHGIINAVLVE